MQLNRQITSYRTGAQLEAKDWASWIVAAAAVLVGIGTLLSPAAKKTKTGIIVVCCVLLCAALAVALWPQKPKSLQAGDISGFSCSLDPRSPKTGSTSTLTYSFTAKKDGLADLTADIYSADGKTLGDGAGDKTSYPVSKGKFTLSRPVNIPAELATGTYELTGEVWPSGRAGDDGADTIVDDNCATVTVK